MRRKFSKLMLIPLGVSLLLPNVVANAAEPSSKTSADFADLAGVDAALKAKIDALLAKGVFDGVSDDSFGIDQNMTRAQMAKVITLIYGLKVDQSVTTSSFKDVSSDGSSAWSIPFIEAAKKAGIITGMTDSAFNPGDTATLGQLATALVRGLGKKVDLTGSPWYSDAVQQAIENKLLPEGINGKELATRQDLVVGAFNGQDVQQELVKKAEEAKKAAEEAKKKEEEAKKKEEDAKKQPETPSTPSGPSTSSDTTAPTIIAATVNGRSVTVTEGTYGSITLKSSDYLTGGTLTVSEASTLKITSIEGIDLTGFSSLSFTQSLSAGSNGLDFINTLASLDPQHNGVSMATLAQLDSAQDGLVVTGTLSDSAGNVSNVKLTFNVEVSPSEQAPVVD